LSKVGGEKQSNWKDFTVFSPSISHWNPNREVYSKNKNKIRVGNLEKKNQNSFPKNIDRIDNFFLQITGMTIPNGKLTIV
jgi:hypothetical protein